MMQFFNRNSALGMSVVALLVTLAAWLMVELIASLQDAPYVSFLAGVMIAGWLGGIGPGLVAVLASVVLMGSSLVATSPPSQAPLPLLSFAIVGTMMSVLNEIRRRRDSAEQDGSRSTLGSTARALEDERARFEAVLQQMPGGVAIVDVPSGKLIMQNHRAAEIVGLSVSGDMSDVANALGQRFREAPPLESWPLYRALHTGESVHDQDMEFVDANRDRVVLRTSAAPIRDADGTMVAAVATFEDVTDLKTAAESLHFLQETSMTLAASLDFDTTLKSVVHLAVPHLADWCLLHTVEGDDQPARMTAAHIHPEKARLLEMLYTEYPVPDDARHGYTHVMRTGEVEFVPDVPRNWTAQARDARHADYLRQLKIRSLMCLPLRVAGRIVGALTLTVGDSGRHYGPAERRLAEHFARRIATAVDNARLYREIAEADRRKSEFLALMAHELRNPLAPMRNAVEILRLTDDPATAERMRALLERQLGHMARLIGDLVDLSRVERNQISLHVAPVDISAVARRAAEAHRGLLAQREQALVESLPPEPIMVRGDAVRLEQIISNLLDNAGKFTDARGTIEVRVEPGKDSVQVLVRDSGRGIRPEFLPHVFESFRRAAQPGSEPSGGLGIGLTLVKRLVEMHGGTVSARSAGPAQGSEFIVNLPRQHSVAETESAVTATSTNGTHRLRALVCDDNARAADTLATLLRLWGYDVDIAYDGESALASAGAQWPDVALLDLALPGIDGYQVASNLRGTATLPRPLIVAITGHGHDEDRRRSQAAGFDHHLVKPIDPLALEALLRGHQASLSARG